MFHEYPGSAVGKAFSTTAKKITDALGTASTPIPGSAFVAVSKMVNRYGAEIVVLKLAKIAKKANHSDVSSSLSRIFLAA